MSSPRLRRRRNAGELNPERGDQCRSASILSDKPSSASAASRPIRTSLAADGWPTSPPIYLDSSCCASAGGAWLPAFLEPEVLDSHRPLAGRFRADRSGQEVVARHDYLVESNEFRIEFRTNTKGYRARPGPTPAQHAYRVAFVGDSFTEGMQVAYESTFCARLESLLTPADASRALVCENFGVSATDLLEYWHRIHHDVLAIDPPDALVLCIYPGNDFQGSLPDEAFDGSDKPLAGLLPRPGWAQHVIAWINLHSKFGCYAQRALLSIGGRQHCRERARRQRTGGPTRPVAARVGRRARRCGGRGRFCAAIDAGMPDEGDRSCASWWSVRSPITRP